MMMTLTVTLTVIVMASSRCRTENLLGSVRRMDWGSFVY